jgi:hypothetical protein
LVGLTISSRPFPDKHPNGCLSGNDGAPHLEAEVGRLIGLGASRKEDIKMGSMRWTTLLDPEGNEFDVIAEAA